MQCALNGFCASTTASSREDAAPLRIAACRRELMVQNTCPQNQYRKGAIYGKDGRVLESRATVFMISYSPTNHVFVFNVWVRMMKES